MRDIEIQNFNNIIIEAKKRAAKTKLIRKFSITKLKLPEENIEIKKIKKKVYTLKIR